MSKIKISKMIKIKTCISEKCPWNLLMDVSVFWTQFDPKESLEGL